jgi:putative ABC transport system permease protein
MHDLRLALRSLRAAPIVSIVAALSLALGIGANTAIFSLINGLLLRSLPVAEPDRLVILGSYQEKGRWDDAWSFEPWDALRTRATMFDGAFATGNSGPVRLATAGNVGGNAGGGAEQPAETIFASGDFFSTLGLRPAAGQFFTAADDVRGGGPRGPVAVISYGYWQRRFGGEPSIVGSAVKVDGVAFTIVGVTPPRFYGVQVGMGFDVVLPLSTEPIVHNSNSMINDPIVPMWLRVMFRLKPGQSIDEATTALRGIQPVIREAGMPPGLRRFPQAQREFLAQPFTLVSAATGTSFLRDEYTRPLVALLMIVALVLLIACANIANLQLARATVRRHEMSVRLALGASRGRLARLLFVESLLLAAIGAGAGLLFAIWGSRALVAQLTSIVDHIVLDLSLDWRVLAFTGAITVITAVLFGTAPAWRATRVEPIEALKDQGRQTAGDTRSRVASGIVIAQVALSLMLLVTAGLLIRTFDRLAHVTTGFDEDRLLLVIVNAARTGVRDVDRAAFYQRLVDTVSTLPGVVHASGSIMAPFGSTAGIDIHTPGEPPPVAGSTGAPGARPRRAGLYVTTPGWIATYGLTLRAGRDLSDRDTAQSPLVMLVNEAFVRAFLPDRRAEGERIGLAIAGGAIGTRHIVGVVSDAISSSLREPPKPTIYLPMTQWDLPVPMLQRMYVTARVQPGTPPASIAPSVSAALRAVNQDLDFTPKPLSTDVRRASAQERLLALLSACFGAVALLLAAIGMYGVTAYAVSRRRLEIGIRMALGAAPAGVVGLVLTRVLWLVATGLATGAIASAWLAKFIDPLLFGVPPRDPITLSVAALTLAAMATLSAGLPATRASRLDPARVLRNQ